jgi:ACR3 family arsenite efflux pump ArsB
METSTSRQFTSFNSLTKYCSGAEVMNLFPRRKNPPTVFGGLVLTGVVIVIGVVLIYAFGSHANFIVTVVLVAIGLIFIVLAVPVYKWEKTRL